MSLGDRVSLGERKAWARKPRLLDLFSGAGGAAMGYHRAGFEVVGVDLVPQKNYPFAFIREDAIKLLDSMSHPWPAYRASDFDAIHASPPCQKFTAYRRKGYGVGDGYPDLIGIVREMVSALEVPWVIENVPGAPLENPIQLCGSSFGLDVRRHRLFETSFPMLAPPCNHASQRGRFPAATNRAPNSRKTVEVGVWRIPLEAQKQAMGVDWDVTLPELSEMVPPAYTRFLGEQLMSVWERKAWAT